MAYTWYFIKEEGRYLSLITKRIGSDSSRTLSYNVCSLIVNECMQAGAHVREMYFADKLRVSRTPIRAAFKALEVSGVLERRPNKGFFLRNPEAARQVINSTQENHDASLHPLCFAIARDYLNERLARGFTESDIVRHYAESRATIQQSLIEMEKEGWIQRLLGYGWEFNDFLTSSLAYEQCYRFRILIEPAALLEPTYNPDKNKLEQLKENQQALLDSGEVCSASFMFNSGVEFHESIVGFSGNSFLLESLQKANRLRRLIEYNVHASRPIPRQECNDHLYIIFLLENNKYIEAAGFLEAHLKCALDAKLGIARGMMR